MNIETITLRGPHGSFEACARTGQIVTPAFRMPRAYQSYSSVDVQEFRRWCRRQQLGNLRETSILCVGLRRNSGHFEAPAEVFREEWAASHLSGIDVALA